MTRYEIPGLTAALIQLPPAARPGGAPSEQRRLLHPVAQLFHPAGSAQPLHLRAVRHSVLNTNDRPSNC